MKNALIRGFHSAFVSVATSTIIVITAFKPRIAADHIIAAAMMIDRKQNLQKRLFTAAINLTF